MWTKKDDGGMTGVGNAAGADNSADRHVCRVICYNITFYGLWV